MKVENYKLKIVSGGFTLLEILFGMAIFIVVAGAVYFSYSNVLQTIIISQFNLNALNLAESEIESVRNLPYELVGVQGGVPTGILSPSKTVVLDNAKFIVKTTVRNIDDPFDGLIGGSPNDLSPADYKLVEIEVSCETCQGRPVRYTARVAPQNLEGATNNGALFVKALDAFGQVVSGAEVKIINTAVNPPINLLDVTGLNGLLQLVDTIPSISTYEITVSKPGYSLERTYPLGGTGNPNPLKPHATVAKQKVTSISFAIDKVSAVNFKTTDLLCRAVSGIDFSQTVSKLIGTDPNVLKYSAVTVTDGQGQKVLSNLEWDTYIFKNIDTDYDISGTFSPLALVVDPNQNYNVQWLMDSKKPRSLLVTVKDVNGQLLDNATATLFKTGFQEQKQTGHRLLVETDWSGSRYATQSGKIDAESNPGELRLVSLGGQYASHSQEWLTSSTIDFGTNAITFYKLLWKPTGQPSEAGLDSLKFQLATNNDNLTWNYFGPDGTASTYYSISDTVINAVHNQKRYLRYKVFMKTDNGLFTPSLEELQIEFNSSCVPSGQTFYNNLTLNTYGLTVTKTGYQAFSDNNLSINGNWQEYSVTLIPNP